MGMHFSVGDLVVNRTDLILSSIKLGGFTHASTNPVTLASSGHISANTPGIIISPMVGEIRDMRGVLLDGELVAVFETQLALVTKA